MSDLAADILNVVKSVYKNREEFLPLEEPLFKGNESSYVQECIDTGWVSSAGKYVDLFEEKLAEYCGVSRAVAVVNGTAALQVALRLAGVERNDEVVMPNLTFVATGNAASYLGAIPHFVGVESRFLGMDISKLEEHFDDILIEKKEGWFNRQTNRRVAAIVPMHTFGHPVDMDYLGRVAGKYRIAVVEDAAESLGSTYQGKHMGSFGDIAAISFNGNKIITTGAGGAILTNNDTIADLAKHLTTTARTGGVTEFAHDQVGYNFRMPNINAALGVAQMEMLDGFVNGKRAIAAAYEAAFADFKGVQFVAEPPSSRSNYWLCTIKIEDPIVNVSEIIERASNEKIQIRPSWTPLNELGIYESQVESPLLEKMDYSLLNLPSIPL